MRKHDQDNAVFLPFHIGSGNRGCEAITKATVQLLGVDRRKIHVLTNERKEDRKVGIHKLVCLHEMSIHSEYPYGIRQVIKYLNQLLKIDLKLAMRFTAFLMQTHRGDIVFVTGGDLYCYPDIIWQLKWVSWLARIRGCNTILWGCSLEEQSMNKRMVCHLKKYDFIYARECLTKNNLEERNIKSVKLMPDSAFILESSPCQLPDGIGEEDIVGINVSSYTNANGYSMNTIFYKNMIHVMRHILENTKMSIMLIPHVFWDDQDDRILLKKLYRNFMHCGRVFLLNSEKLSYSQIRYAISRCRFFMGARTHAMISAYAMGVPSLALGYSIKSKGIAKDLGIPEELLVDCGKLKTERDILQGYLYLLNHENIVRQMLINRLPEYLSGIKVTL